MDAEYTGKQISERRKSLGLTQKELAEKLHVTDKAVSKWERGINFPDLGLMENLANALDTTPACLLGLEDADRDAVVSSITEISNEQLEDARKDMRWLGWGGLTTAVLLTIAYFMFGNDVVRTQKAYLILHCVIVFIGISSVYLLFKYGQIKKFDVMDIGILYIAAIPVLVILGIQFLTGYSPNTILATLLIAIAACSIQLLCCRILVPYWAKALPLILSSAFAVWHIWNGRLVVTFAVPAICCFVVWLIFLIKNHHHK